MTLNTFVDEIIAQGIPAAETDYKDRPDELEGAKQGFEACRGKNTKELTDLLTEARRKEQALYTESVMDKAKLPEFKKARAFAAEVHWVCNVLSVVLEENKLQPLVPPTARGVIAANKILGGAPA